MVQEFLGHLSEAIATVMAEEMDAIMMVIFHPCRACTVGKAKKANVPKRKQCSTIAREKLFIEISLPTATSLGGKKYWLLIFDDFTDNTELFLKEKSELPYKVNKLMKELKVNYNIQVKTFNVIM